MLHAHAFAVVTLSSATVTPSVLQTVQWTKARCRPMILVTGGVLPGSELFQARPPTASTPLRVLDWLHVADRGLSASLDHL